MSVPTRLLMIRPNAFGFNPEAAESNAFQTNITDSSKTDISISANKEFETMFDNLKSKGVRVSVFNDTLSPTKPDAVFPNNWISFQPDGTRILYPMCVSVRRAEIREDIYSSVEIKHNTNESVIDLRSYVDESQYLAWIRIVSLITKIGFLKKPECVICT